MSALTYEMVLRTVCDYMQFRNYTEKSIETTVIYLKFFDEYMRLVKKEKDYREVTEGDHAAFLEYWEKRSRRGIKKETLHEYGLSLKRVYAILEEEEKVLQNPFGDIQGARIARTIRDRIFTVREMNDILASMDDPSPLGFRDRCIVETFYGTGIRGRELCGLDLSDFLKEEKMLLIRNGKGKKDRLVPVGDSLYTLLNRWVRDCRPKFIRRSMEKRSRIKFLFLNVHGGPITFDALKVIFRKVKEGFPKENDTDLSKLSSHVLRHTFATHMVERGADIREVQMLLGHKSIDATQIYLNFTTGQLREVYEKFHPFENDLFFDVVERERYVMAWDEEREKKAGPALREAALQKLAGKTSVR
jgi:integrase/recombinase XerD